MRYDIKKLQLLLEDLYIYDQSAWASYEDVDLLYTNVIRRNTEKIVEIVNKYGFINPKVYGKRAAHMFYVLVLHADINKKLQQEYFNWLKSNNLQNPAKDGLDIHNLEKRMKGFDFSKLTYKQLLHKQATLYGLFGNISRIPNVPFRVSVSTNLFGNFSYKYSKQAKEVCINRSLFLKAVNEKPKEELTLALQNQDNVIVISDWLRDEKYAHKYNFMLERKDLEQLGLGADAIIMDLKRSNFKGISLLLGDCYGVFFYDPKTQIWGAIHVGNNAISLDFIGKVFSILTERFKVHLENLYIFITPGIKKYGYIYENVDKFKDSKWWKGFIQPVDFKEQSSPDYLLGLSRIIKFKTLQNKIKRRLLTSKKNISEDKISYLQLDRFAIGNLPRKGFRLDLYGALRNRLLIAGVKFDNIRISPIDTLTSSIFPSHFGSYHLNAEGLLDQRFLAHAGLMT